MQVVNLFSVKSMLKEKQKFGEIPSTSVVYKNFYQIAWPCALEAFLVAFIGTVDMKMVSTLGPGAIAAVGITNQPKYILLAVIFSLNIGITAVTARRKGQGDQQGANRVIRVGIIISAIVSILMACIGFLFAKPILLLAGAEESYLADAITFFRVLMFSIPFQSLNLTINAAHRGCGRTKISATTNIISNLINITFDYLLINGIGFFPRLEVKGAAVATLLGAFAAFLISFNTLFRKNGYLSFFQKVSWSLHKEVLNPVMKISSSAFVEQVFLRIGFLAYASIIARLGTTEYATHLICMNLLTLSFCIGDGLSIAGSSLVGQNLGAKRPDLSIVYGKAGQRLAFMISCVIFLVFILGRSILISLFTNESEIITLGSNIMIFAAFTTHMQTSQVVCSGCLRGAGDTAYVALISMLSVALIRPLLTWLLCYPLGLGLYGAWIALLVDQVFRFICNYTRFSNGKWTSIKL